MARSARVIFMYRSRDGEQTALLAQGIEKRSTVFRFGKLRAGAATEANVGEARVVVDSLIPHTIKNTRLRRVFL